MSLVLSLLRVLILGPMLPHDTMGCVSLVIWNREEN